MYLLDSDVIIDFLRNKEPGYSLVSEILNEKLYISVISWIEILYGIKKVKASPKRSKQFTNFLMDLDISVIPINTEIGAAFVELRIRLEDKGSKLADFDLLIASSAKVYNFVLVTKNIKHFERAGIKIFKGG